MLEKLMPTSGGELSCVYVATMISVPQKFCDTLKSLHSEFIWNGKRANIKHSSLIGEYKDGGLKDVDVHLKFHG